MHLEKNIPLHYAWVHRCEDNININIELVEQGFAKVRNYIFPGEYQDSFKLLRDAQHRAKKEEKGIWRPDTIRKTPSNERLSVIKGDSLKEKEEIKKGIL